MFPVLSIGRELSLWLAAVAGYCLIVMAIVHSVPLSHWQAGNEVSAVIGVGLGILLVFRNNTAYDRWWEARKLWGQLINELRNLAIKTRAHAAIDAAERRAFATLLCTFPHALRMRLCGDEGWRQLPGIADPQTTFPHGPGYVAWQIQRALDRWNRAGQLADAVRLLDQHARALLEITGACERILNTPLASSYRALTRDGIYLYLLVAPWAVGLDFGWSGIPVVLVAASFLLGVELTAAAIENPFGRAGDDLPLATYCQTIETFVTATLAEEVLVDPQPSPTQ